MSNDVRTSFRYQDLKTSIILAIDHLGTFIFIISLEQAESVTDTQMGNISATKPMLNSSIAVQMRSLILKSDTEKKCLMPDAVRDGVSKYKL